jgi:hypothetical protein
MAMRRLTKRDPLLTEAMCRLDPLLAQGDAPAHRWPCAG